MGRGLLQSMLSCVCGRTGCGIVVVVASLSKAWRALKSSKELSAVISNPLPSRPVIFHQRMPVLVAASRKWIPVAGDEACS